MNNLPKPICSLAEAFAELENHRDEIEALAVSCAANPAPPMTQEGAHQVAAMLLRTFSPSDVDLYLLAAMMECMKAGNTRYLHEWRMVAAARNNAVLLYRDLEDGELLH